MLAYQFAIICLIWRYFEEVASFHLRLLPTIAGSARELNDPFGPFLGYIAFAHAVPHWVTPSRRSFPLAELA
jgi:hypothetical protein